MSMEMQASSRNSWLQKTLSSIKEATVKKDGVLPPSSSFSAPAAPPLTIRKDSSGSEK